MVIKIAISGKMGSGKSYCAKMIRNKYNKFKIRSFADKLKTTTHELFHERFIDVENNENNIGQMYKNRELYVDVGQSMRAIDPMVWANYLLRQTKHENFVVIDDLRFKNELFALQENGWKIVRLQISKELQMKRLKECYSNHIEHLLHLNSEPETDLDYVLENKFDLVLRGDNVMDDIIKWVDDLVEKDDYQTLVDEKGMGEDGIVDFEKYIKDNGVIY